MTCKYSNAMILYLYLYLFNVPYQRIFLKFYNTDANGIHILIERLIRIQLVVLGLQKKVTGVHIEMLL